MKKHAWITLCQVSSESRAHSVWRISEAEKAAGLVTLISIARLGWLQPDFVTVSSADKTFSIAIADQLATAYTKKKTSYAPLADALYYYKTEGWEIKVFPLVIGVRCLVNVRQIHEVFTFLKIPRREWLNGLECFALASVKAFSFLHRIRYTARSAGIKDAVYHDESTSDHADDSDHGATLDSGDSADEAIVVRHGTTRNHLCQAFPRLLSTPDCVLTLATVRNGNIPAKAISQCERRLLCHPQQQLRKWTPYITPHVVAGLKRVVEG
jgi:hypothetical protein